MDMLYFAAGLIAALTGIVHSVLGEYLIFRHLRQGTLVPMLGAPPLRVRHVRILWASWHLGSVFCWAFAGLLLWATFAPMPLASPATVAIAAAHLGGAVLVFAASAGRHPGWVALTAVAVLTWLAGGTA